ncbi:hypothetical protein NPIL_401311 [Nephila pilipes]|uniref:Uncharacterized protein n=1 Tax=Nephila pilipes TaxID=299642 RepID=A0A8X6TBJ8_NEPPI|nr:hypothetical protein NPIL_401311 [Nephila pilipes]
MGRYLLEADNPSHNVQRISFRQSSHVAYNRRLDTLIYNSLRLLLPEFFNTKGDGFDPVNSPVEFEESRCRSFHCGKFTYRPANKNTALWE